MLTSCTRPSSSAATPDGPALPAYLLERGKPADDAVTEEESSGEDSSSGDSDDDGKDDRVTSAVVCRPEGIVPKGSVVGQGQGSSQHALSRPRAVALHIIHK